MFRQLSTSANASCLSLTFGGLTPTVRSRRNICNDFTSVLYSSGTLQYSTDSSKPVRQTEDQPIRLYVSRLPISITPGRLVEFCPKIVSLQDVHIMPEVCKIVGPWIATISN